MHGSTESKQIYKGHGVNVSEIRAHRVSPDSPSSQPSIARCCFFALPCSMKRPQVVRTLPVVPWTTISDGYILTWPCRMFHLGSSWLLLMLMVLAKGSS